MNKYREPSIDALRDIIAEKQATRFRYGSSKRRMLVDLFTASAIVAVYDQLTNEETKVKIARMIAGTPEQFLRVAGTCFKCLK